MDIKKYRNAGGIDRVLRVVIASVLIYFGFINTALIGQTLIATLVGILGIVNILVAITGICPIYTIAGISTCPKSKT
jgi:uncharacterized membrane protein YuzA (DUF378 family)